MQRETGGPRLSLVRPNTTLPSTRLRRSIHRDISRESVRLMPRSFGHEWREREGGRHDDGYSSWTLSRQATVPPFQYTAKHNLRALLLHHATLIPYADNSAASIATQRLAPDSYCRIVRSTMDPT